MEPFCFLTIRKPNKMATILFGFWMAVSLDCFTNKTKKINLFHFCHLFPTLNWLGKKLISIFSLKFNQRRKKLLRFSQEYAEPPIVNSHSTKKNVLVNFSLKINQQRQKSYVHHRSCRHSIDEKKNVLSSFFHSKLINKEKSFILLLTRLSRQ